MEILNSSSYVLKRVFVTNLAFKVVLIIYNLRAFEKQLCKTFENFCAIL